MTDFGRVKGQSASNVSSSRKKTLIVGVWVQHTPTVQLTFSADKLAKFGSKIDEDDYEATMNECKHYGGKLTDVKRRQVWTLTPFFLFRFIEKIVDLP